MRTGGEGAANTGAGNMEIARASVTSSVSFPRTDAPECNLAAQTLFCLVHSSVVNLLGRGRVVG